MTKGNDILNELRNMDSPLADMSRSMPYVTPPGYFSELAACTVEGAKASQTNEPAVSWTKHTPYQVPAGYFDDLTGQIATKTILQKKELALYKEQPFGVPAGYFEQLPTQVLRTIKAGEQKAVRPAKTIPLGKSIWKNIRWAAAALLILGVGLGSYEILITENTVNPKAALAEIPRSTVNEYVQQNIDEFDMDMIENTIVAGNTNLLSTQTLTDEDIIEYLDEAGWEQPQVN